MDRVTGNDESYLLAEQLFGLSAPIQFCWVLPRDPGSRALAELHAELSRGALSRRVVRARVPFARARWVRSERPADVVVSADPVADADVAGWFDARVRSVRLDPVGGRGWELEAVALRSGRMAVSLLVSHMVSDGQGVYRALDAAVSATSRTTLASESAARGVGGLRADAVDAVIQIASAARSLGLLLASTPRAVLDSRRSPARPRTPAPVDGTPARSDTVPEPTLAFYDLDRTEWRARAAELGGTANSLFTGMISGLAHRAGVAADTGDMRVCMAVSTREGDEDLRANASGGVWITIPTPTTPATGLSSIRAASKQAFADYAATGDRQAADNLQPVVRLLPRRLIAAMMRSIPGPDTTVSNLGAVPESALRIGDVTAESFSIRALMQGQTPEMRRATGPALAAWAVEYGSTVTIAFFGISPDHFGDPDALHDDIRAELDSWDLAWSAW
ncbi:hypothetical protein ACQ7HM_08010 [Williamsia sp. MIQD14]|uniref:hypothetical protein n=1 Tax=Williamsia sp. MIQD14 TaxID=3425703 RepID=UPI003DA0D09A